MELLRPFSFLSRDPEAGRLEVYYREVGRGTRLLADLPDGAEIAIIGPLGRPWPELGAPEAALVAGGVGMPPLFDLAADLAASGDAGRVHVFYGGRTRDHVHLVERFEATGVRLHLSTDDGSVGRRGTNVSDLEAWLAGRDDGAAVELFACGPDGMLRAAAEVGRRRGLTTWVSLEAPMACGIGVCRGCAVPHTGGGFKMVCTDGPVFRAEEVYG